MEAKNFKFYAMVVESPASLCVLKYNSRVARPGMLRMRRCNPNQTWIVHMRDGKWAGEASEQG